jgi:hypothetical protein
MGGTIQHSFFRHPSGLLLGSKIIQRWYRIAIALACGLDLG